MKTNIFLSGFLLFLLMCSCERSQSYTMRVAQRPVTDTASIIKDIRARYTAINAKSYTKKTADLSGLSAEGGTVTSYHDQKGIVKDHVILYGEMGKVELDLYYYLGNIFFAFKKETAYDQPIYVKGSKVNSVTESRFYIHQNKLIRCLKAGNKHVPPDSDEFKEQSTDILGLTAEIKTQRK